MFDNHPIRPKHPDSVLRIISVGRLSRPKETEVQTQQSLEAIRNENERLLKNMYPGPFVVHYLAEQISGMVPDRATMIELWKLVDDGIVVSGDKLTAPQLIQRPILGSGHEPRSGFLRHANARPLFQRTHQRVLREFFGKSDLAQHAR